jgi:hypothetical protein
VAERVADAAHALAAELHPGKDHHGAETARSLEDGVDVFDAELKDHGRAAERIGRVAVPVGRFLGDRERRAAQGEVRVTDRAGPPVDVARDLAGTACADVEIDRVRRAPHDEERRELREMVRSFHVEEHRVSAPHAAASNGGAHGRIVPDCRHAAGRAILTRGGRCMARAWVVFAALGVVLPPAGCASSGDDKGKVGDDAGGEAGPGPDGGSDGGSDAGTDSGADAPAPCGPQNPCDGGMLSCPPGTVVSEGQCDDVRCADELPSGSTGSFGLPNTTNAWPRFRHDNRNTGWTRAKVASSPKVKWMKTVGFGIGPAIDPKSRIFVGAQNANGTQGWLQSLDPAGNALYSFLVGATWDDTVPVVRADGVAYFSTADAQTIRPTYYAIDPQGGAAWSYTLTQGGGGAHPIVAHDGTIVFGQYPSVYAFDPMGALLWQTDVTNGPGQVMGGMATSCDGARVYVGGANGWATLDIKTGANVWRVPVPTLTMNAPPGAVTSSPVVTTDGTMYGIDDQGVGWAIDVNGNVLWTKPIGSGPYGERVSSAKIGNLLVVIADGNLVAVDTKTGAIVWKVDGAFAGGPVVDGNVRIYANDNGTLRAFDVAGNPIWQVPTGQQSSAEMAIGPDGTIYVQTNAGSLFAIQ